jgi:hypothetical protein
VNEFVEECRREWKRLGVPDPVANEMAADLEVDLKEAEDEGASAEEVLGTGAFDPRSFASAWAAERGVIERSAPSEYSLARRSRLPVAIAAFALIAIIGAVLMIEASSSGQVRLALPSPGATRIEVPLQRRIVPPPLPVGPERVQIVPRRVVVVPPPRASGPGIVAVEIHGSDIDSRRIGGVMLIVGLAGIVLTMLFRFAWTGRGRWSRSHISGRPTLRA